MERPRASVTSYGGGTRDGGGSITISGLTPDAIEAIQGMIAGENFVGFDESGAVSVFDRIARLPDPLIEPFEAESWVHSNQVDGIVAPLVRREWGEPGKDWGFSIAIQHLCGYGFSMERYRTEARKLQSWGFACLRSRRDRDGKRWEIWFLPGIWAAEAELAEAFPEKFRNMDAASAEFEPYRRKVVDWFCRNASFGTIDLMVQRAAMVAD